MEKEVKPTVKGRLMMDSPANRGLLLHIMRNFKDAIEYAHSLMRKGIKESDIVKLLTSRILNNAHYSYSALVRARLYRNQPYLKLKKPQLFSVGKRNEKGNRNIRLVSADIVKIKIPSSTGQHRWIVAKVRFGSRYLEVIKELVNAQFPYGAGIYLKNGRMELHVNVPLELYVEHLSKIFRHHNSRVHVASFDFNSDRICMVIVSRDGDLLDVKTEHFPEITSHGFPKDEAKDIRMKALTKLVSYAHHHGVTDYVAEKLSKPKTKTRSKSANRKIAKFALREYIGHLKVLVPRYSGRLHFINPAYTSIDAIPLSRKLGLDVHTTSAYLLALRYLNL